MVEEEVKPSFFSTITINYQDIVINVSKDEIEVKDCFYNTILRLSPPELIELIKQLLKAYLYFHPAEKIDLLG
jgi:hypothetical protein